MLRTHYLKKTPQGVYHYRQAVPKVHQTRLGKTELVLSLFTKDPREARKRASLVIAFMQLGWSVADIKKLLLGAKQADRLTNFELAERANGTLMVKQTSDSTDYLMALREIARLEGTNPPTSLEDIGLVVPPVPAQAPQAQASIPAPLVATGVALSEVIVQYKLNRSTGKGKGTYANPATEQERMFNLDRFAQWHKKHTAFLWPNQFKDNDLPLPLIDSGQIASFRSWLEQDYAPKTVAKSGSYINALFKWAQLSGYYPKRDVLPTLGQFSFTEQDKRNAEKDGFQAFSLEELQTIVDKQSLNAPHEHWTPLIAMFSGCRRQDIGFLTTDDFPILDGIQCIHFKGTKSDSANRTIPLHPELINLGLLIYVSDVRALNLPNKRLFPYLYLINGQYGKQLSDYFSDLVKECNITRERGKLGLHSFRDTFNQAMQDNGTDEAIRCKIVGQKHSSVNFIHYSKEYLMKVLQPHVNSVVFPISTDRVKYQPNQHDQYLKDKLTNGNIISAQQQQQKTATKKALKRAKVAKKPPQR